MKILHISDPHYELETMRRLDLLAQRRTDCDVVAVTGDVVKKHQLELPVNWDSWPQRMKWAVPGNHGDHSRAFTGLTRWQTGVPWCGEFAGVGFVCLGVGLSELDGLWLSSSPAQAVERSKAVVVLTHRRPRGNVLNSLRQFSGTRPLLILHGDEHPKGFPGTDWSTPASGEGVFRGCSRRRRHPTVTETNHDLRQPTSSRRNGVARGIRVAQTQRTG